MNIAGTNSCRKQMPKNSKNIVTSEDLPLGPVSNTNNNRRIAKASEKGANW
jgi:hypothetical protein